MTNRHPPKANPRNRLSKFYYTEDDPDATVASEEVLITTVDKPTGIHAAGWCDFKPSAFADVSWLRAARSWKSAALPFDN